jgi:cytochrome P450
MVASVAVALLVAFLTPVVVYLFTRPNKKPLPGNLPPGSLGLPMIGQSLGLLRAMRSNTGERWLRDRVARYGPVSKLSLLGAPTVFMTGPAANKLVFASDALAPKQPRCLPLILGRRNILELVGDDYRRVRGAMMQFLKPDMLRRYVGTIDAEVARHLDTRWAGRRTVAVLPLMKLLTFDIIATLLFGLERGAVRERLAAAFADMLEGMWAVPLDLPFTTFRKSLRASARARRVLEATLAEKRARLERGEASPADDLVSCLASLRAEGDGGGGERLLTDEEIVDNAMVVLVAGHDTSSVLMTFMIRHLAGDPATLAAMVQGNRQERTHSSLFYGL